MLARHNALTLIAEPQGHEWQLVQAAANRLRLSGDTRVYVIRPTIDYRSTERVYADEYGSLSTDAQWAVVEMFSAAMRQRFPSGLPEGTELHRDDELQPADHVVRSRPRFARAKEPGRARAGADYRFATLTTSGSM